MALLTFFLLIVGSLVGLGGRFWNATARVLRSLGVNANPNSGDKAFWIGCFMLAAGLALVYLQGGMRPRSPDRSGESIRGRT